MSLSITDQYEEPIHAVTVDMKEVYCLTPDEAFAACVTNTRGQILLLTGCN